MDINEIFEDQWSRLGLVLLSIFFIVKLYSKYVFSYWDREKAPSVRGSFPFGSIGGFIMARKSISEVYQEIYNKGNGKPVIGYYSFLSPALVIRDPDLIRCILVKDSSYFNERGVYYNEKDDPLSAHLFALDGEKWKDMRVKMSPAYTSGKMKYMYDTMKGCSRELIKFITDTHKKNDVFEVKQLVANFAINVIAVTAIGVEGHNLREGNDLSKMAFKVTDPNDLIQAFRFALPIISRSIAELFKMRFTPKCVSDYYMDAVKKIINYRIQNNIVRNDFMQLLIEINKKAAGESGMVLGGKTGLTLEEIAAQTFVFILAGFETQSSTLAFCLYELATNPDIQEKLYEEIKAAGDDISYEKLHELTYLEMVLNETWRKYPPTGVLIRQCARNFETPEGFVIKKGTKLIISLLGLQRDPDLFPDPDVFDPERFNKESPTHTVKPFSYLPFGDGPRVCIGKRFGVMTAKLGLVYILSKYKIVPTEKTKIPPRFEEKTVIINPKGGMHLRFVSRT